MSERLGIWPVRAQAEKLGALVAERLGGELIRPWELPEPQKGQFQARYAQRPQWVLVMATGIATRFLEGVLLDKHRDPAVVVLDEAGRYAVALLGGHEAGANVLAYRVANAVGAIPVVTTASEAVKPFVAGIGCRRGVSQEQIERAVRQALAHRELSAVRELATIDLKAGEPGLSAFSQRHGIPLRVIATQRIVTRPWVTQGSDWVRQSVGVDGVCEPCALIACTRGRLVVPKTCLEGVAVALVEDVPEYAQ
jgi:cobalt-precorrin 5A hydrolase